MKFKEVKTLEHLLKEYGASSGGGAVGGGGHGASAKANKSKKSIASGPDVTKASPTVTGQPAQKPQPSQPATTQIKAKDLQDGDMVVGKDGKMAKVYSKVGQGNNPSALITKDDQGNLAEIPQDETVDALQPNKPGELDTIPDEKTRASFRDRIKQGMALGNQIAGVDEGKLGKLAKRKGRKLQIRKLKGKIKKLAKSKLKEANPKLFEINFNRKTVAKEALNTPVKCGFEAETFFYNVEGGSNTHIDDMSIADIEYEYGDLPDSAYEDYNDWLYQKGQEDYLDDLVSDKVQEVKEDEDWLNEFIDSSQGPSSEAIERYKVDFEDADPQEYENREEDGWSYMNWVREYVEEEYEDEYLMWLDDAVREDYDLDNEAKEAAEGDYDMNDWIYDNYSYMSDFLNDYGFDYPSASGDVEGVADVLMNWIKDNSKFTDFPESGDYGDTYTTTGWAVEKDSSIDADEGTAAELISPVFSSPRQMLTEMKSLFEWGEEEFGTNNTTGLHVTMSWNGEPDAPVNDDGKKEGQEPNKLKMALLLGDEYLLAEFGRLKNSYTKSQYRQILKHAEGMKRGDKNSFEDFEKMLEKGISQDKFSSIHFKNSKDSDTDNELIEFRIAGGSDYNEMYDKVVKAVVRYATIMKAGYDENAYRKDYVSAVSRLLRKSQEIDPKKLKDLELVSHPIIDSAKGIVGKKDYFDVVKYLSSSVEYYNEYEDLSDPDADKEWKQEIADYKKGTGRDPSWVGESLNEVEEREPITGYIEPPSTPPSKRAESSIKKSQERFANAVVILARNIADGNTRGTVRAKDISIFRDYTKKLELDDEKLQALAFKQLQNQNYNGTDKENIARLKKGISTLFKKDIIQEPGFMSHQDLDLILKQLWQFFQSDISDDYSARAQLADLLLDANPNMTGLRDDFDDEEKHNELMDFLHELSQQRQLNTFVAKLKGSGYGNYISPVESGKMTNPDGVESLKKFLEPYGGYEHPTSKDHHINIKSDDKYEDVAKSSLIQKCRIRLDFIKDLKSSDSEKYEKIKTKLLKIGDTLVDTLVAPEEETGIEFGDITDKDGTDISGFVKDQYGGEGKWCLSIDRAEWNRAKDFLVKAEDDEDTYNFTSAYDDYIIRNPFSMTVDYYKSKQDFPSIHKHPEIKKIVKKNFAGFKKFFNEFDKIFTSEGFTDLKAEISDKDRYDKRNKDFEKNIRDNSKAKLNIPSHSFVYFNKDFWETLTDEDYADREAWVDNNLNHFEDDVNREGKVYVIPSAHWSQAEDATNGLEIIQSFENAKNYFHTWRKTGYNKILSKFMAKYNVSYENLNKQNGQYVSPPMYDIKPPLRNLNIEVSSNGDSRAGAPGVKDLVDTEELKNPNSGEPINRGSAHMWDQTTDNAEQKRFDAFDWGLYPAKMKDIVAKVMKAKKDRSFQTSLEIVLQKVLDDKIDINQNELGLPDEKIMYAAGVEGKELEGEASETISDKANWTNLADYLKLERGVNDQGVNLLKRVHDQYNSDGQKYRTEDDNITVGMERWLLAVKDAIKYIEKNYTVSGGNYFRDGDDVSGLYSKKRDDDSGFDVTTDDYEAMRSRYYDFNTMMMNGIQNYILQPDVNRLVGFLKNDHNDEAFKKTVLQNMMREREAGEEPNDFPGHLARARVYLQNESVFNKFENLPLEEQLIIISKSKVLENLSRKSEGPSSDALPDNSIPYLLNKLLAEPMPAGDLRKQMDAYWALPIPQMLSDFRAVRAQGGRNADCRNILKQYINSQLDPQIKKHVKLVENKDDVIDRIKGLPDDDVQTDKVVQYIEQLLDDMGVGGRLASLTSQLEDIDDEEVKKSNVKLAKMISSIDMTPLERAQLFASWKKDTLVNVDKLLSGSGQTFSDIFKGYGDETYMTEFIDDLADVDSYGIGAGEFLLAVLSKKVRGIGATGGSGDLIIDGKNVEVKTKTSRNARFKDWHVQPDQTWASKVEKFKEDFADIDEVAGAKATGMNSAQLSAMLKNPVLQQNPQRKKQALLSIMSIFKATNTNLTSAQYTELAKLLDAGDDSAFKQKYGAYNILNYLNIKRSDGELEGILFMNKKTKTVTYVKDLSDIQNLILEVGTVYPISTNSIYPYPQIGVK